MQFHKSYGSRKYQPFVHVHKFDMRQHVNRVLVRRPDSDIHIV